MSENFLNGKEVWLQIFKDLKAHGKEVEPRGQLCLEIEDYTVNFHPVRDKFCSFDERNLSMKYLAGELAWYLGGDRDDCRIEQYSKFWSGLKNKNSPLYNSNYGFYIFKERQFQYVIETLTEDKDSRQAVIMINRREVAMSQSKDKLCTNAIMFRIRDNKLNMTVQMRSNDVIFGLGIDCPMFCWVYEMVYQTLLATNYPDLEIGNYFHTSGSFHIYQRHFEMMDAIVENVGVNYMEINCPKISSIDEVNFLISRFAGLEQQTRDAAELRTYVKPEFEFTRFMESALEW